MGCRIDEYTRGVLTMLLPVYCGRLHTEDTLIAPLCRDVLIMYSPIHTAVYGPRTPPL